jgi:hypothetical protein
MKYAELIAFDPIESVVQLHEANAESQAQRLVETFVISDGLARTLTELVFPQLQFTQPADTKGLMIVGNYGTGKSHLMAVISAVAEHADLASRLTNATVTAKAPLIAGRFKVIRAEIGSTTKPLRDIVCDVLENGMAGLGVEFAFPAADARHENKTAFQEMMAAFQERYPDHGLLLVVDELLDYLRSRKDLEINLDLSFLREVGEVCKGSRFRFITGVQESLFDNPGFQFVADMVRRVKDRFEQLRIAREDVAFVVAERLLKKTPHQQALIRAHLEPFAPLYGSMNERMAEFVRLYPVHPAYLETFERVYVAEKREVLKTLSAAIRALLDQDVPTQDPGVIAYDSYWSVLRSNPSFLADPDIKKVLEKSEVLESRIQQAFPTARKAYKPTALRIIHALAVHRLTTSDIYRPLGATAEELRDDLCLLVPNLVEQEAGFLLSMVEKVLNDIIKTVNGQFISANPENGQYYLDLKKDIDYDALIEKKADTLAGTLLDRYYFEALRQVVLEEPGAKPHVSGYRIWEYELEWRERKAGRSGYLFFGAPNERSTAQPPRDFYLYFLPPFEPTPFKDELKADEVFFTLAQRDDTFERALKLYAGAREQAITASGSNKSTYEDKASKHLQTLTTWLRDKMPTAVEVTHQGQRKPLREVVQNQLPAQATVREMVNTAGALRLATAFIDRSPDYPCFSVTITRSNREQAAQEALRWIAGSVKSKQGAAVLDALELLDGDLLKPRESRYARQLLDVLTRKGQGQVINRAELVQPEMGVDYWTPFRLEPEFLAVVAAALVHSGDLVISLPGKKIDAASLDQFARLNISEAREFKHLERPKDLPLAPLQDLCDLFGVAKGLMVTPATRDEAVTKLQVAIQQRLNQVVIVQDQIGKLTFWGQSLLSEAEQQDGRNRLGVLKTFLESLQPFNTPGKLKNFPHDVAAVQGQHAALALVREIEALATLTQQLAPQTAYLGKAEALLPADHPWQESVRQERSALMTTMGSPKQRAESSFQRRLAQTLTTLKTAYQDAYLVLHGRARLDHNEDQKKAKLTQDPRLKRLQNLSVVEMMPKQQLNDLQNQVWPLKTCFHVTRPDLDADPVCPHCQFRPTDWTRSETAAQVLETADAALDTLDSDWRQTLLNNLADPTVAANLELVSDAKGKAALQTFIQTQQWPATLSAAFIQALQEVLGGLQKRVITTTELCAALAEGGWPCTVEEWQERFRKHLATVTKGKDVKKIRVVLE